MLQSVAALRSATCVCVIFRSQIVMCSVFQFVADYRALGTQDKVVCCSMWQYDAVRCSALQCVVVYRALGIPHEIERRLTSKMRQQPPARCPVACMSVCVCMCGCVCVSVHAHVRVYVCEQKKIPKCVSSHLCGAPLPKSIHMIINIHVRIHMGMCIYKIHN